MFARPPAASVMSPPDCSVCAVRSVPAVAASAPLADTSPSAIAVPEPRATLPDCAVRLFTVRLSPASTFASPALSTTVPSVAS